MNIYWGDPTALCPNQAALEVLLIIGPSNDPESVRYSLDPCSGRTSGATGNNFTTTPIISLGSPPFSIGGNDFLYRYSISGISNGLIARIIPIYKNAMIAVVDISITPAPFPSQGVVITSTGKAKDTTIQRKLNVFQGFSFLPIEYVSFGLVEH